MHGTASDGGSTASANGPTAETESALGCGAYPVPTVSVSLRHAVAVRSVDDDGEPILIITDGVSSVSMESGLYGVSVEVVAAARRLAESAAEFAATMAAAAAHDAPTGDLRRPRPRF